MTFTACTFLLVKTRRKRPSPPVRFCPILNSACLTYSHCLCACTAEEKTKAANWQELWRWKSAVADGSNVKSSVVATRNGTKVEAAAFVAQNGKITKVGTV
jgi:hypothetical protein